MLAPVPSMEFESEILLIGNPDSGKKQHALEAKPVLILTDEISQNNLREANGEIFQYSSLFLTCLNGYFHRRRIVERSRPKRGRASFGDIGDDTLRHMLRP